jgi:O-antigen/teichoic acid export membrane protein
LAECFTIVPVALMASLLPLMSEYYLASKDNFKKIYQYAFKYLLIFIIPVAVALTIFSDQTTTVLFGKEFLPSSLATRILIWAEVFVFVGIVNNSILISSNKQKIDPVFTGTSAAVNIILNVILIPRYSFIGAAIASLVSYAVGPIMGYFIPSTTAYSRSMLRFSLRPFLASLVMAYCISLTCRYSMLSIFISPFIYFSVLYFLKGITAEDIGIMRSIALGKSRR